MISTSDVLQILSEVHQYSMILIELKNTTTIGICHSSNGNLTYFEVNRALVMSERSHLVKEIYSGRNPASMKELSMEQFLISIEGKRPRHIWLETKDTERRELGFLSISELKAHLRIHPKR